MKFINTIMISIMLTAYLIAQIAGEAMILETKTGDIKGTLLNPSQTEITSVVLIIAGSGPTDRNGNNPMMTNNSLKMLADALLENGIASLRYDKRGVGESMVTGLKEKDLRFEHYVDDAKDWIDYLKSDQRFSEIIVLGHSEGSLIGMIAAQKQEVSKFISVAGVGMTAGEILREQLKNQPPIVLEHSLPIIEKLEAGETVEDVPAMLQSLFRPSVQPYLISWFKYEPQKEIVKLEKPILIIQGTTDIQVKVAESEKLADANPNAVKVIIEGMNHILKESEMDWLKNTQTYSMPDLPLKPELIEAIVNFLKNG